MRQRQPVSELRIKGVGDFFQPLQSLCDVLGDGLVIGDHEGRILLFNQAARRMMGLPPGASLPQHWWDLDIFYLPDKVTRYPTSDRPLARALRGERDNLEVYVRPSGADSGRWFNCTVTPLTDQDGEVVAGVLAFRDVTEQVEGRIELIESKRRLEQAQRVAHVGSWEWNLRTNLITWTDENFRLFGLEPGSVSPSYEGYLALVHPDDRARVEREVLAARQRERPFDVVFRVVHPDGTLHFLRGQAEVTRDTSDQSDRMLGTTQDVTERKLAEDVLKAERATLQAIIENTTDSVFIKDRAGRYLLMNKAGAAMQKRAVEDIVGKQDSDRFPPASAARLRQIDERVMADKQAITVNEVIEVMPGDVRIFSTVKVPYTDAKGEVIGVIGISRDITEQQRAEEAMRRNNALLQAQQAASIDGILVIDEQRQVVDYNQRFLDLWGLHAPIPAEDREVLELVRPQVKQGTEFMDQITWLYEHPVASTRSEVELVDGRTFERYTAPVRSEEGRPYGRVWFFRDITERKQLEEQLKTQCEALQELDRLKSDFVSAVTHELRTPLTSIMGYAEFLEEGIGGDLLPHQLEFVRELMAGARRLEALLNDLLDFARIEAGTFKLVIRRSDLNQKVEEILASLRPQAQEACLTLVDATSHLPLILPMDAQRVGQVLINLLNNAIKFTPEGGMIRVRTAVSDGRVVCRVEDSGVGIAPEDLPKLFNRFSQLEAGRKKKAGVGLGLSISKSIIEAHGGRMGVESEPGKGATFWFTLPCSQSESTPG